MGRADPRGPEGGTVNRLKDLAVWAIAIVAAAIAFTGGATFQDWLVGGKHLEQKITKETKNTNQLNMLNSTPSLSSFPSVPSSPLTLDDLAAALIVARAKSPLEGKTAVILRVGTEPATIFVPIESAELVQGRLVIRAVPLYGGG